jgi:hypothetical protein
MAIAPSLVILLSQTFSSFAPHRIENNFRELEYFASENPSPLNCHLTAIHREITLPVDKEPKEISAQNR